MTQLNRQRGKRAERRMCQNCSGEYLYISRWTGKKYCSQECYQESRIKCPHICPVCGKTFEYRNKKEQYCSPRCAGIGRSQKSRIIIECAECGKKFEIVQSQKPYRKYCSAKCRKRAWQCKRRGEGNSNWHGGIKPTNRKIRDSDEYKEWRESVFIRDQYTCQICGQHGGKLHAHHLESFSQHEDLRFNITNGITLCFDCHKAWHLSKGDVWNLQRIVKEVKGRKKWLPKEWGQCELAQWVRKTALIPCIASK